MLCLGRPERNSKNDVQAVVGKHPDCKGAEHVRTFTSAQPDSLRGIGRCRKPDLRRCADSKGRRSDQDRLWHGTHWAAGSQRQDVASRHASLGGRYQCQRRTARATGEAHLLRRSKQSIAQVPAIYSKLLDVDKVDLIVSGYASTQIAAAMPVAIQRKKLFVSLFGTGSTRSSIIQNIFR